MPATLLGLFICFSHTNSLSRITALCHLSVWWHLIVDLMYIYFLIGCIIPLNCGHVWMILFSCRHRKLRLETCIDYAISRRFSTFNVKWKGTVCAFCGLAKPLLTLCFLTYVHLPLCACACAGAVDLRIRFLVLQTNYWSSWYCLFNCLNYDGTSVSGLCGVSVCIIHGWHQQLHSTSRCGSEWNVNTAEDPSLHTRLLCASATTTTDAPGNNYLCLCLCAFLCLNFFGFYQILVLPLPFGWLFCLLCILL